MTEKSSKYLILNLAEESEKLRILEDHLSITPNNLNNPEISPWNSVSSDSPTKYFPEITIEKSYQQPRRKYTDPLFSESPLKTKIRQGKALSSLSKHQKLPALIPKVLTPRFSKNPNPFNHNFQSISSLISEEFSNSEKFNGAYKTTVGSDEWVNEKNGSHRASLGKIGLNGEIFWKQGNAGKFVQLKVVNKGLDVEYEAIKKIKPRYFNCNL